MDKPKRPRRGKIPISEKLAAIDEMIMRREVEIRELKDRRAAIVAEALEAAERIKAEVTQATLPQRESAVRLAAEPPAA